MSDLENKGYDLDNFDDKKLSGRHFKGESEDFSEILPDNTENSFETENSSTSDYGDDFYSTSDTFEPSEEEENTYVPVTKKEQFGSVSKASDSPKKKNIAIIILSIALALTVFIFALIAFIDKGNDKNDDKKETTASTVASETVDKTETPTEKETQAQTEEEPEETEAQTQAQTEAPTEAPTQAPTEEPTQPATQAPTEAPSEQEDGVFYL